MPMLPSGRYVAVIRDSLSELLDNAEQSTNVHKVLAIQVTADIYPYTDLVWLLPASQARPDTDSKSYKFPFSDCSSRLAEPIGFRAAS